MGETYRNQIYRVYFESYMDLNCLRARAEHNMHAMLDSTESIRGYDAVW